MPILETERLSLSELALSDAPFLLELMNDPAWIRFIGDRNVRTVAQAEAYFESRMAQSYRNNSFGLWLVTRKADQQPIGICGLVKRDSLPHADLGFAFLEKYRGRGYAAEAAAATVAFAKESLKLPRLLAITVPENRASVKLLEKLGMQFTELVHMPEDNSELKLFSITLQEG